MSARSFVVFMGVIALIGLLAFGLLSKGEGRLEVGEQFPTKSLDRLGSASTASIADYGGRWVLVNLWASWCEPCKEEAPEIEAFYRRYGGDGFVVLGIDTQEDQESGLEFVAERRLTYPQLHDGSGDFAEEMKATGVPENILVDPEGDVALVQPGPVDENYLETEIAPLIGT